MVKRAVRACKRNQSENNVCHGQTFYTCPDAATSHSFVKKAGSPTWDHDGEIDACRDALATNFGAEPLSLDTEPQIHHATPWIPPETPVQYMAQWAVAQLSTQSHWQGLVLSIRSSTGSSCSKGCRPMSIWLTAKQEHAGRRGHPGKCVREIHWLRPSVTPSYLSSCRFLVRLGKAFDTSPRDSLWSAVVSAANLQSLSVVTLARAT